MPVKIDEKKKKKMNRKLFCPLLGETKAAIDGDFYKVYVVIFECLFSL